MNNKKRNMGCIKQDECSNYGVECSECFAMADIYNHHPCYRDKDFIEVVRCKYCKHYVYSNDRYGKCELDMNNNILWKPTDFCSYGERRK